MEYRRHPQDRLGPADESVQDWINNVSRDLWSHTASSYGASPTSDVNTTAAYSGGTSGDYFTNSARPWIPQYDDHYAESIGTSLETPPMVFEDEVEDSDVVDQNKLPPELSLCEPFSRAALTEVYSLPDMGATCTSSHEGAKATRGKKKKKRESCSYSHPRPDAVVDIPERLDTETGSLLENPAGNAAYPEPEILPSLEVLKALPFTTGMDPLRIVHAPGSRNSRGPFFWEFLLRLLADTNSNPSLLSMENTSKMIVCFRDHYQIAKLWGLRQGKDNLSYPHFSRSLRWGGSAETVTFRRGNVPREMLPRYCNQILPRLSLKKRRRRKSGTPYLIN
ncbi:DNA-binding protein D-ETS-4-like isoform X2 [Macrobrachium nipponense]|uniref:DNA-binding protein D-ETS-4-like isoform X2 n=1 Tax=Macrobrachium nipponense TaxID=159736 RepID=UPI0030C8A5E0